jgi:CubicO group peptidase (beta-lactamase class C family)
MKILRRTLTVLAAVLVAALTVLWLNPPDLLRVGANYAAKIVCSNVFLAARDPQEVLRTDVQAPGVWILKLYRVSVDREHAVVRAGMFGFIGSGLAVARAGQGCTALPDGQLPPASSAEPVAVAPAHADAAWPQGERVEADPVYQHIVDDEALGGPGLRALVVIDHGRLVAERYGGGFSPATPLLGWSMAKTVTASLVGLLVKDGRLSLDQSALWPAGDGRDGIKLSDLLAMSSGLAFNEDYGIVSDVTRMLYLEPDMAGFAYAQPLAHPPGTVWKYSSGTANIVARIVQAAAGGSAFAHDRLFAPLGMASAVIEPDERGTLVGSSYVYATAHDWARFGQFLLQDGQWSGQALLPAGFVEGMARPVEASKGEYGHGFVWLWGSDVATPGVNPDTAFGIPPDTFYLSGHDGQSLAVIRSRQLVVVRLGLTPHSARYSTQPLLAALLKARPVP